MAKNIIFINLRSPYWLDYSRGGESRIVRELRSPVWAQSYKSWYQHPQPILLEFITYSSSESRIVMELWWEQLIHAPSALCLIRVYNTCVYTYLGITVPRPPLLLFLPPPPPSPPSHLFKNLYFSSSLSSFSASPDPKSSVRTKRKKSLSPRA